MTNALWSHKKIVLPQCSSPESYGGLVKFPPPFFIVVLYHIIVCKKVRRLKERQKQVQSGI